MSIHTATRQRGCSPPKGWSTQFHAVLPHSSQTFTFIALSLQTCRSFFLLRIANRQLDLLVLHDLGTRSKFWRNSPKRLRCHRSFRCRLYRGEFRSLLLEQHAVRNDRYKTSQWRHRKDARTYYTMLVMVILLSPPKSSLLCHRWCILVCFGIYFLFGVLLLFFGRRMSWGEMPVL